MVQTRDCDGCSDMGGQLPAVGGVSVDDACQRGLVDYREIQGVAAETESATGTVELRAMIEEMKR